MASTPPQSHRPLQAQSSQPPLTPDMTPPGTSTKDASTPSALYGNGRGCEPAAAEEEAAEAASLPEDGGDAADEDEGEDGEAVRRAL